MPYKNIKDLPEQTDKLTKSQKKVFMEAFNNAYKEYKGNEKVAFKVAWSAVKKHKKKYSFARKKKK